MNTITVAAPDEYVDAALVHTSNMVNAISEATLMYLSEQIGGDVEVISYQVDDTDFYMNMTGVIDKKMLELFMTTVVQYKNTEYHMVSLSDGDQEISVRFTKEEEDD